VVTLQKLLGTQTPSVSLHPSHKGYFHNDY